MEVLNYFESGRQAHWLSEIGKSDWDAGRLLHHMLKSGEFFDFVGAGSRLLLLVDGDALVSYCTYAETDDIRPTELHPWVGFVYTFPAYRGRRCVGRLFAEADRIAREEHVPQYYISTNHTGLYEKYGCTFLTLARDWEGEWSRIYVRKVASAGLE